MNCAIKNNILFLLILCIYSTVLNMEAPASQETVGAKRERLGSPQEERPQKMRKTELQPEQREVPTPMEVDQPAPEEKAMEIESMEPARPKRKPEPLELEKIPKRSKTFREQKVLRRIESKSDQPEFSLYYTQENLAKLYENKIRVHAPCLFLIDQYQEENTTKKRLPLTLTLYNVIRHTPHFPIVVSSSLLFNLLERARLSSPDHPQNKYFGQLQLSFADWTIFKSPSAAFVILIPRKFYSLYQELPFRLESWKNISNLLPGAVQAKNIIKDFVPLQKALASAQTEFLISDFKSIFAVPNHTNYKSPLWDFFLLGHGVPEPDPLIAGLKPNQINDFFSFIDRSLLVVTVYLQSCRAGGKNLRLLEFDALGIARNHQFILMVGSITDSPIWIAPFGSTEQMILLFFNYAALIQDKGASLNRLLLLFSKNVNPGDLSLHGTEQIPQVWLPGGMGFQTFNIDNYILVLGNVMARVHADEQKPIIVNNKQAILLYPLKVSAPLYITPFLETSLFSFIGSILEQKKKLIWPYMPMVTESAFWQDRDSTTQKQIFERLQKEYPALQTPVDESKQAYLYPQIISMIKAHAIHYLKEIRLDSDKNIPSAGVIRFLRDAFLDIAQRTTQKAFYIDKLSGYNDISLLLEASRILKGIITPHALEQKLAPYKNQPITLSFVYIQTVYKPVSKINQFKVSFVFDDTAWEFTDEQVQTLWPTTHAWNFKSVPLSLTIQNFQNIITQRYPITSTQKKITEILKQKIASPHFKK